MDPFEFEGAIRFWDPEKRAGLAVVELPPDRIQALGGLKQQRVHASINGASFVSSVMPAGGGRLALSLSKATMAAAGATVGGRVAVRIERVGRE